MREDTDVQRSQSSPNASRSTNGSPGSTHPKAAISSVLNGSDPTASDANGTTHVNGTRPNARHLFGHDLAEITRILIQGLSDLGYPSAANALTKESGFELETTHAAAFRTAIMEGEWRLAEALIVGAAPEGGAAESSRGQQVLALAYGASQEEMLFQIRQQKYLELLEKRDLGQALMVLRQELQPLRQNERQLHALSTLLMCQSPEDLKSQAVWDGASGQSRKELLSALSKSVSPSAMIPEHRLAELLTQVQEHQVTHCLYHNSHDWPSLYADHQCGRDEFPMHDTATLDDHTDEVWMVEFSNNGQYLATASQDTTCRIYDTTTFQLVHTLADHNEPTTYIAWSPDDSKLLTCSQDCHFKVWDVRTGRSLRSIHQGDYPVTTAAWAPDGRSFATGSQDVACPLAIWDAQTSDLTPMHNFERVITRVMDCAIAPYQPRSASSATEDASAAPVRLVAICSSQKIHVFDWARRERILEVAVQQNLTSISLAPGGTEMLVNLGSTQELWALDVETGEELQKYRGQAQGEFVIRSAYGGATGGFVVCGGEDSKVSVWHRHSGRLLLRFKAHTSDCVNAVAWNMARPDMFASVGDDRKVRIWTRAPGEGLGGERAPPAAAADEGAALPSWGGSSSGLGTWAR